VIAVALVAVPRAAQADARFAIGNDAFTEVSPPIDDSGFTNDLSAAFWRPYRGYQLGGSLFHRWLTEVGGPRREDQVELLATLSRIYGASGRHQWSWTARLGPTATGNFGGRWMQNAWHTLSKTGPSLAQGLQNRYIASRAVGAIVGGRLQFSLDPASKSSVVRSMIGDDHVQLYGWLDGQLAVGTGVSSTEATAGLRLIGHLGTTTLTIHGELALAGYSVSDSALALPGGYGVARIATQWRVGASVAWSRYRVEYEYRANEGGSGEPIGVVALTVKQAGTQW
jgi:hypothetical protein